MSSTPSIGTGRSQKELTIDSAGEVTEVLTVLEDEECRSILAETSESPYSVNELAEECDIPLSTAYRKVDRLADAGLIEEQIRLSTSGKHTSEYRLAVNDIQISIGSDAGIELSLVSPNTEEVSGRMLAGAD